MLLIFFIHNQVRATFKSLKIIIVQKKKGCQNRRKMYLNESHWT